MTKSGKTWKEAQEKDVSWTDGAMISMKVHSIEFAMWINLNCQYADDTDDWEYWDNEQKVFVRYTTEQLYDKFNNEQS